MWNKIQKIYVGTNLVRPEPPFKPWANTVVYYPLNLTTTLYDQSWNDYNLWGNSSAYSFTTKDWVECVYFPWNGGTWVAPLTNQNVPITWKRTRMCWCYANHKSTDQWVFCTWAFYGRDLLWIYVSTAEKAGLGDWYAYSAVSNVTVVGGRHHLCATFDYSNSKEWKIYVDGVLCATNTFSWTYETWNTVTLWSKSYSNGGSQYSEKFNGYVSEAIFEDRVRTATEISNYYNKTKSTYWIS